MPCGSDRHHPPKAESHLPRRDAWGHRPCCVQSFVSHGQQQQGLGLPILGTLDRNFTGQNSTLVTSAKADDFMSNMHMSPDCSHSLIWHNACRLPVYATGSCFVPIDHDLQHSCFVSKQVQASHHDRTTWCGRRNRGETEQSP